MTVGTIEAIADIGPAILLCIDHNQIANPDLFAQLTAWNRIRRGRSDFYRSAPGSAGLPTAPAPGRSRPRWLRACAPEEEPVTAISCSSLVPRACHYHGQLAHRFTCQITRLAVSLRSPWSEKPQHQFRRCCGKPQNLDKRREKRALREKRDGCENAHE